MDIVEYMREQEHIKGLKKGLRKGRKEGRKEGRGRRPRKGPAGTYPEYAEKE